MFICGVLDKKISYNLNKLFKHVDWKDNKLNNNGKFDFIAQHSFLRVFFWNLRTQRVWEQFEIKFVDFAIVFGKKHFFLLHMGPFPRYFLLEIR